MITWTVDGPVPRQPFLVDAPGASEAGRCPALRTAPPGRPPRQALPPQQQPAGAAAGHEPASEQTRLQDLRPRHDSPASQPASHHCPPAPQPEPHPNVRPSPAAGSTTPSDAHQRATRPRKPSHPMRHRPADRRRASQRYEGGQPHPGGARRQSSAPQHRARHGSRFGVGGQSSPPSRYAASSGSGNSETARRRAFTAGWRLRVAAARASAQQQVELLHAAPAAPASRPRLRVRRPSQCWRSASSA